MWLLFLIEINENLIYKFYCAILADRNQLYFSFQMYFKLMSRKFERQESKIRKMLHVN